ncbi:hypothetical protein A605_06080 [Corynebacterium halotolerans YIM 70093 = DSM 44683]|uniref:MobA-like NTP transferase domain-containing protein n=1 Tax=Corynebacterium halotolerans YIM 70093 = DSM 44683 TaxID=1121362 RepID=M1NRU4_9CORY|nr:hypothetical protein A605_06080 [Corynebacterium halotolerans YIM 70093 = DSM 44683]
MIILAGGRGSRMGGVDKSQVRLDGVTLLDRVLDAVTRQLPGVGEIVVVSPHDVPVPAGVAVVSEDPPFGGPAAGVAAGFAALDAPAIVLVFSVDAPESPRVATRLLAGLVRDLDADVAVVRAADGHLQPLCAAWRGEGLARALENLGDPRDVAAKKLLAAAGKVTEINGDGRERDYDTVAELSERGEVGLPEG